MGNMYNRSMHPDVTPEYNVVPSFDPLLGVAKRKIRAVNVSKDELESAKIPIDKRDYCSDKLIKYRACRFDAFPWIFRCHHEKHEYDMCEYEDYVLRMKEFERERRLLERQKRIQSKKSTLA